MLLEATTFIFWPPSFAQGYKVLYKQNERWHHLLGSLFNVTAKSISHLSKTTNFKSRAVGCMFPNLSALLLFPPITIHFLMRTDAYILVYVQAYKIMCQNFSNLLFCIVEISSLIIVQSKTRYFSARNALKKSSNFP